MVSAVRSRPNYYELLGLSPTASDDEITKAFAKAMGMFGFHPIALATQLSAAFETLRNPAKRQDYDRSIGLVKEPEPQPQPQGWAIAAQRGGTPFFGLPPAEPPQRNPEPSRPPAPRVDPLHRPAAPAEPRLAPFIAASLREPAKATAAAPSEPAVTPEVKEEPKAEPNLEEKIEPNIADILAAARATIPTNDEERAGEWKRPALVVGGVVLAVGLVGGIAGMSAGGEAAYSQQNEGVTVPVPAAKSDARTPVVAQSAAPGRFVAVAQPGRTPISRTQRRHSPRQPTVFEKSALDGIDEAISQPQASPGVVAAPEQASAETPSTEAVPATLPLPNRVIARTIDRIGYSCGSVASATAVEGAQGVYKINCTSGQSYQASPVRGRYHFRRLSRN